MTKIRIDKKKALQIAFILSVTGILTEVVTLVTPFEIRLITILQVILRTVSFRFGSLLSYRDFDSALTLEYFNLLLNVTLLVSAILYKVSHGRETRLIRFSSATLMAASGIHLVYGTVVFILTLGAGGDFFGHQLYITLFNLLATALVCILSYHLLVVFSSSSILVSGQLYEGEHEPAIYKETSKARRLFHLLFDSYLCLIILSPLSVFLESFWSVFYRLFESDRMVLFVMMLFARMIYYPFFEYLFGATPAKLITASRVVDARTGLKPSFKTILLRTLCRFIPFEPFSFLANANWHDKITGTSVADEQQGGVPVTRYWLLLLSYVVLTGTAILGKELWSSFSLRRSMKKDFEEKVRVLEQGIENLKTDNLIETGYSSIGTLYLKVEEVKPESVMFTAFVMDASFGHKDYDLEKYYDRKKDFMMHIEIPLDSLRAAINKEYLSWKDGVDFFGDGRGFRIERIIRLGIPRLESGASGIYGNTVSMTIKNTGWPVDIMDIKNVKGNIKWKNDLPERISIRNSVSLYGEDYERGKPYQVEITVKDTLNKQYRYLMEGRGLNKTLTLIE